MLKKQSKKLAIMLIFSLIATLFVGVGAASAANIKVEVDRTYTWDTDKADSAGNAQVIGVLSIYEEDSATAFRAGDSYRITLNSGVKWGNYTTAQGANTATTGKPEIAIINATGTDYIPQSDITVSSGRIATFTLPAGVVFNGSKDRIEITGAVWFDGFSGDTVTATIETLQGTNADGVYTLGKVTDGGSVNKVSGKPIIGAGTTNKGGGTVMITETSRGSFKTGTLKIKLPKYVSWHPDMTAGSANAFTRVTGNTAAAGFNITNVVISGTDDRDLEVTINVPTGGTTNVAYINIATLLNVDSDCSDGDISVTLSAGSTGISTSWTDTEGAIAAVADYGAAVSAKDEKEVVSGVREEELGTLIIKEDSPGSITQNRNIEIELPKGVKLFDASADSIEVKRTAGASGTVSLTVVNERKVTVALASESTSRVTLEVRFKKVNVAGDFSGDVNVTVKGRAGITGEAVIGTVLPALSAKVTPADVKIGFKNQAVGNIVLTEAKAEAVSDEPSSPEIVIVAPSGVSFSKLPTVEVTEGNLDLDERVALSTGKGSLIIDVKGGSTKASVITISGIELDIDRTVPVGTIVFEVNGSALLWSNGNSDYLFDVDTAFDFVAARCVTPSSVNVSAVSQFVIGSTTYTLNDIESTMPTAPYIKDNRTYLVLRFTAMAMGISESNIMWDPDNRTVTLMKDSVVVQLTIGSKIMKINGADITLDVAPEISNNYTMLPIGVIAQAFGYTADWDAATQTVTINPVGANDAGYQY